MQDIYQLQLHDCKNTQKIFQIQEICKIQDNRKNQEIFKIQKMYDIKDIKGTAQKIKVGSKKYTLPS